MATTFANQLEFLLVELVDKSIESKIYSAMMIGKEIVGILLEFDGFVCMLLQDVT